MTQQDLFVPEKKAATFKTPREYQDEAVVSIFDYFSEKAGSPLVVVPTAGGKSLIMAEFIRRANVYFPGTRVLVLSHVSILLEQNAEELLNQWPEANISFYSAQLNSKDLSGQTIFAGIQSIYKKAYELPYAPDLILIDECHLLSYDDNSMYRSFLDDMKVVNPHVKVVGFTATPYRADRGMLHKGKNALFTDICCDIPVLDLINQGYLAPIVTPQGGVKTSMNATGIKTRGGDYTTSGLSTRFDNDETTASCIDEIIEHGKNRKKWIVFTIDIEHCTHVTKALQDRGVTCDMVHSKRTKEENAAVIRAYREGRIQCLVNVSQLTTGFNEPGIDMMASMRPTRSPVLYVQTMGRGMRTCEGKTDCLLLDFGRTVDELGPIDQVRVKEKIEKDEPGDAPMKTCEWCGTKVPAGCLSCPECGADFPERDTNLTDTPSDAPVLSSQLSAVMIDVHKVSYYVHKKEGKPDSLRVDYLCGIDVYREWICLEHSGAVREKACRWWRQRSGNQAPNTIAEATRRTGELRRPSQIKVRKIGRYHEIIDYNFGAKQ